MDPASPGLHVYYFVIRVCYPRPLSRETYVHFRKSVPGSSFAFGSTAAARDGKIVVVLDIATNIVARIGFPNGINSEDNVKQY